MRTSDQIKIEIAPLIINKDAIGLYKLCQSELKSMVDEDNATLTETKRVINKFQLAITELQKDKNVDYSFIDPNFFRDFYYLHLISYYKQDPNDKVAKFTLDYFTKYFNIDKKKYMNNLSEGSKAIAKLILK